MAAVNICAKDLGLRPVTLVVLDALLSCLAVPNEGGREALISQGTLLTVYASNETLCFRAKGLADRQLRRHLATLETVGLLQRRDSANGKRFPVMKGGKVIGAYGMDLSPLFARAEELLDLAHRRRQDAEELRGLKAQILRLRSACAELLLDKGTMTFIDQLRNLVRRATLTLIEAKATLQKLTGLLSKDSPSNKHQTSMTVENEGRDPLTAVPEVTLPTSTPKTITNAKTDKMTASDGQNVRHKESESNSKKISTNPSRQPRVWNELAEVSAFFAEPTTSHDLATVAFDFGRMLRISEELLSQAVQRLGVWDLLKIEDQIARTVEKIANPNAYLRAVLRC